MDGFDMMQPMCVGLEGTLFDCLKTINEGGQGVAFILDSDRKVVGCVTDGDIRRALIDSADLESTVIPKIMKSNFISVGPQADKNEVLNLMRLHSIQVIPVIDENGEMARSFQWNEMIGAERKENWAVIMAGGKGSRLGSITATTPKPMLTVGGTPILERLVTHLASYGIGKIFLAVNHLSEVIETHFGDGDGFGCDIHYLREDKPLGTGGALSLLPEIPEHDVVVMNGDLVTQIDIADFLEFHVAKKCDLTMAVRDHFTEVSYGVVDVQGDLVEGLSEKPQIKQVINCGMYVLSPEVLQLVPKGEDTPITWLVEQCLERDRVVGAYPTEGKWIDIGNPSQLREARNQDID